ncbi:MAG: TerC family protein [Acidimicrobiales bacterium]
MITPAAWSSSLVASAAPDEALRSFHTPDWLWASFAVGVVVVLLLDLFVFHRTAHEITMREAAVSSIAWISLGVAFAGVVWWTLGSTAAAQYLTGYVIEKSLSVDNVFVWAVIFSFFAIPNALQHRVLFWGIFGAIVLRGVFVFAGVALLNRLEWLLFVFGGFLILTAIRVARHDSDDIHPEDNPVLRLLRRVMPVSSEFHGQHMFVKEHGRRIATPLFVALVLIEATDVVFAVDSVPAVLAISRDPFVVLSSNVAAILGLRALYFLLAGAKDRLVHLNKGLGIILAFVGGKMILSHWYHVPALPSLAFIGATLAVTVIVSLRAAPTPTELEPRP